MKTAVVYYSMSGNTAYVADRINEELGADTELIELKPVKAYPEKGFMKFIWGGKSAVMAQKPKLEPYAFNAASYDRIIIGFPVWASRPAPPLRTFAEAHKDELKGKAIAAYACQAGSGAEKALQKLKEIMDIPEFKAVMILTDPKERPDEVNERMIEDFCDSLR